MAADAARSSDRHAASLEPRLEVDTSAIIRLINLVADLQGRILDISLGGCHIRTERHFPVGIFELVEERVSH